MTTGGGASAAAAAVVAALAGSGVRHVVLCPGSRSAPLAYALHAAEQGGVLRLHVRHDERSAGFVALGVGRATLYRRMQRLGIDENPGRLSRP